MHRIHGEAAPSGANLRTAHAIAALAIAPLWGCAPERDRAPERDPLVLHDLSSTSGFHEDALGHYKRGRTCTPGDFDADGRLDLFVGSPRDPAVLLRNRTVGTEAAFEVEVLSDYDETYWSAATLDLDGDGFLDVFAGLGGNESEELDKVFENVEGQLVPRLVAAPLAGPPDYFGEPIPSASAGIRWADLDLDGDLDLFVSTNVLEPGEYRNKVDIQPHGRDRVLLQQAPGEFVDATVEAGLVGRDASFNSTLFDYDNDGDVDLYQNTLVGLNHVWRNDLVETGTLSFTDVTWDVSPIADVRMVDPFIKAFSSAAADLNNDGWEDLIVWHRGPTGPKHPMDWHLVWLNLGGEKFVEVGRQTRMSTRWHECEDLGRGVMGSQVADLDMDGFPDVFIGNGAPDGGCINQLWISDGLEELNVPDWGIVQVPIFRDASDSIDLPVDVASDVPYPYRTHGACIADYDGDALPELAYVNGGPGYAEDWVREPNRLFDIDVPAGRHHVALRPVGDGVDVSREAIGTRVRMTVRRSSDGAMWDLYKVLYGGSGFAAHNGPDLFFGLADADEVVAVEVTWPDGLVEQVDPPALDALTVLER